jgi:alkylhydroperoxidase family enzyme
MSALIPRLEMDQFAPELRETLAPRVKRLGYLGEFFKTAGHIPDVLVPFMDMTEALKAALPDRLTEVGALSASGAMGNVYERNQHERLSEKLGFGLDWIEAVNRLDPDAAGPLSEEERAVQRLTLTVLRGHGHGARDEFEAVVRRLGHAGAMAVLFLIGRYAMHAYAVNVLELAPPVPSIFHSQNP